MKYDGEELRGRAKEWTQSSGYGVWNIKKKAGIESRAWFVHQFFEILNQLLKNIFKYLKETMSKEL